MANVEIINLAKAHAIVTGAITQQRNLRHQSEIALGTRLER
jgi:hypothetical protein